MSRMGAEMIRLQDDDPEWLRMFEDTLEPDEQQTNHDQQ